MALIQGPIFCFEYDTAVRPGKTTQQQLRNYLSNNFPLAVKVFDSVTNKGKVVTSCLDLRATPNSGFEAADFSAAMHVAVAAVGGTLGDTVALPNLNFFRVVSIALTGTEAPTMPTNSALYFGVFEGLGADDIPDIDPEKWNTGSLHTFKVLASMASNGTFTEVAKNTKGEKFLFICGVTDTDVFIPRNSLKIETEASIRTEWLISDGVPLFRSSTKGSWISVGFFDTSIGVLPPS